ncbi:hypothetical protein [Burkholderia sp. NLJ2]|uniref:hypothetical protein n=1 Tax=Burkholderia sp. NLJ2 TaxID=3090699 RepID=UPI003C6C5AD8
MRIDERRADARRFLFAARSASRASRGYAADQVRRLVFSAPLGRDQRRTHKGQWRRNYLIEMSIDREPGQNIAIQPRVSNAICRTSTTDGTMPGWCRRFVSMNGDAPKCAATAKIRTA